MSGRLGRFLQPVRRLGRRLLFMRTSAPLGIYGAPNAGKSSLANVFCEDFAGEVLSAVSPVPHETREVRARARLVLTDGKDELVVDVLDTPGLSSRVTLDELTRLHGMGQAEAEARAREAVAGMLDAVKALETVEGILLVVDSTRDPLEQVNEVLLANAKARRVPVVVVANKVDLPDARPDLVQAAFGASYTVVPVSARTRQNVPELYGVMCREFDK